MIDFSEIKISLTGPHGSGKTTLMGDWSKKHNVPVVAVSTRQNMPKGGSTHLDILKLAATKPELGIAFQEYLIKERDRLFRETESGFISDRSVFDSYVYYALHNSPFSTFDKDLELANIAWNSLETVDLVVVLAPTIRIEDDSVRITNPAYFSSFYPVLNAVVTTSINQLIQCQLG